MPTTKKPKPTQLMAVSEIMLTAKGPLTLKEIARKTARKTGKPASEAAVSARLRDLRKPGKGDMKVVRTAGPTKGVYLYEVFVTVDTPVQQAPVAPARPITFGRPASNVTQEEIKAETQPAPQVAGSRSAMAFVETLAGK